MTCRELTEFLLEYLSGELSPSERATFEEHLAECPDCVHYLESYRTTVELGKACFDEPNQPVPKEVPEELVRAILSARRTRRADE